MRILIVDTEPLIEDALGALLYRRGHEVVAGVSGPDAAEAAARGHRPDLVLVHLGASAGGTIEATRRVTAALPGVGIVVLTSTADEDTLFQVLRAGARGCLTKDLRGDSFCDLLEGIEKGGVALSPGVARKVLRAFTEGAPPPRAVQEHLTEREVEVLTAMTQGITSNRLLAKALCVSENTVRFHIRNILTKLHLHSRAAALAWALTHEALTPWGGE